MYAKHMTKQSGGVLGGLILSLLILIAIAAALIGGLAYFSEVRINTTQGRHGQIVNVETPIGSMRVQEHERLDPAAVGVPVYPGAVREERNGRSATVEFSFDSSHPGFSVVAAEYSTEDSIDRVIEFYRRQLPHWIVSHSRRRGVQMEYSENGYQRLVAIEERAGRTRIGLASIGEPASN